MTISIPPLGPDIPPALAQLLMALREAVTAQQAPTQPLAVFAVLEADLPPAADHPHRQAILLDSRKLVISTYSGSAWEWTNADGSAF